MGQRRPPGLIDKSDPDGALRDDTTALKAHATTVQPNLQGAEYFFINRGEIKIRKRCYPEALRDFSKVLVLNPKNHRVLELRGNVMQELGDFLGAIAEYNRAIEAHSEISSIYLARAEAKQRLNDFTGALADYDDSIGINPHWYPASLSRSELRQKFSTNPYRMSGHPTSPISSSKKQPKTIS